MTALAGGVIAATSFGSGLAAAGPDFSGMTYGQAVEKISSWGSKAVIASVVGDQLAMNDCVVTSGSKATNLDSSGRSRGSEFLLHLNCNQALAAPGKPGNSVATPEGRKVHKDMVAIAYINEHPDNCDSAVSWCQSLCDKYPGSCSNDLLNHLAAS
ncbi:hypothetical protein [Mycolicibacterium helvum]|nr:hypothetical protein [Mycolicibacterium helvum]